MEAVKKLDIVSGRLCGINEDKIFIGLPSGWITSYPYNGIGDTGLDIDIQWLYENMGCPVICQVEDGTVTEIKAIGGRL